MQLRRLVGRGRTGMCTLLRASLSHGRLKAGQRSTTRGNPRQESIRFGEGRSRPGLRVLRETAFNK
eukprot:5302361-Prymnesium_polylepis.1